MTDQEIATLDSRLPPGYLRKAQEILTQKGVKAHASKISDVKNGKVTEPVIMDVLLLIAEAQDKVNQELHDRVMGHKPTR